MFRTILAAARSQRGENALASEPEAMPNARKINRMGCPRIEYLGLNAVGGTGAVGRGRGRLGTMTHHEDLAEADRLIADCVDRIARQREVITTRYEQGLSTDVAESMLRALEHSLRALTKHRQYIVDRLKDVGP
jgi:hypothetical protein